jgi:type IV secretion system protein VirB5
MNPINARRRTLSAAGAVLAVTLLPGPANATVPVIDIASIIQLVQQLSAWRTQLLGMETQINQLRQTYAAMTGPRGMQSVMPVSPAARNYLPATWPVVTNSGATALGAYGSLGSAIRADQTANAVMTPADLARFSPALQALLSNDRQGVAASAVAMRTTYAAASSRFTTLQTLISEIGATTDAKAIAELQSRIAAEQAMIANDGIKVAAASQIAVADAAARELVRREQIVVNHGAFAARLQPAPPAP